MKSQSHKINWHKIKGEYLTSTDSLRSVLRRYKVSGGLNTENHTKGWKVEREKLHNKIVETIKSKMVTTEVTKWEQQTKLWKAVEGEAEKILDTYTGTDYKMDVKDLSNLCQALQTALKSQRLIVGESTENVSTKNIHIDLVELIKEAEKHG